MARGRGPRGGPPLPEGADVAYALDQLISRTWKLDEINEGFAAMRGDQVARGVVVFN